MRYNKNVIAACHKFTPGGDNKQFGTKILPSLPFDITHVKKEYLQLLLFLKNGAESVVPLGLSPSNGDDKSFEHFAVNSFENKDYYFHLV